MAKALIKAKSAELPVDFLVVSIAADWKMEIKVLGTITQIFRIRQPITVDELRFSGIKGSRS